MSDETSLMHPSRDTGNESGEPIAAGRPLREMGFADILDTTFSLYRDNLRLFLGITATLYVPFGVIQILLVGLSEAETTIQIFSGLLGMLQGLVVVPMVMGALVFAIAQEYLGKQTTIDEAFSRVKFWSVLGATWLIGLAAIGLGITVIGLPFSLYFAFRWSLFCPCIMVEGYPARGAMRRSSELVRGAWWRVFGIEIVLMLMTYLVSLGGAYGLGAFLDRMLGTQRLMALFLETVLSIFTTPIGLIGTTLLYFDFRIRKEAFDIEIMAKNIHGGEKMSCPNCGKENDDQARFCQACGAQLQTDATGPSIQQTVSSSGTVAYAGFWRRFAAFIIDGIILGVVSFVIQATLGDIVSNILGFLIGWVCFAAMESSSNQATVGKIAIGIVVTDLNGDRTSFGRATGRYFGKIISSVILCIGFLMAAFTEKKQALHDIMAGCLVVHK